MKTRYMADGCTAAQHAARKLARFYPCGCRMGQPHIHACRHASKVYHRQYGFAAPANLPEVAAK